ncbi:MAG: NADH-quinone oxidoreductase subunit N [Deinococcus sp.]|nr:NADH-quinone oxidoreductase subunit N [Deinococcus sp.]
MLGPGLLPDILLTLLGCLLVLAAPFYGRREEEDLGIVALVGLALVFIVTCFTFGIDQTYFGVYRANFLVAIVKLLLIAVAFLVTAASRASTESLRIGVGEFYGLVVFTTLGGMLMVGAKNLLLLYLGLELSSYSTYVLVGYYRRDVRSNEAAAKYFMLGALSSAFLLYGISLLYGATGTLDYQGVNLDFGGMRLPQLFWPGMALILVGFAFKLALVPFHAWTPDVYQGAPTIVVALLSVGPKAAAVTALLLFLAGGQGFASRWGGALVVMSILSMTIGNLQAMPQENIKRLLGYSSIAQLGNVLIGLAVVSPEGYAGVVFYTIAYAFTNVGAFVLLAALAARGVREDLASYAGLGKRSPFAALALVVFLCSLAGIPPLAGFFGKFLVFQAAMAAGQYGLAIVAVVNTIFAFYYYFRVVAKMYLSEPAADAQPVAMPLSGTMTVSLALAGTLVVGIFGQPIISALQSAVRLVAGA